MAQQFPHLHPTEFRLLLLCVGTHLASGGVEGSHVTLPEEGSCEEGVQGELFLQRGTGAQVCNKWGLSHPHCSGS